jgi:hypothetical protein
VPISGPAPSPDQDETADGADGADGAEEEQLRAAISQELAQYIQANGDTVHPDVLAGLASTIAGVMSNGEQRRLPGPRQLPRAAVFDAVCPVSTHAYQTQLTPPVVFCL